MVPYWHEHYSTKSHHFKIYIDRGSSSLSYNYYGTVKGTHRKVFDGEERGSH